MGLADHHAEVADGRVIIGYEPVWAIGPGKTPPEADEIGSIADHVGRICVERFGVPIPVVYGGGLKRENAAGIASHESVSGGLVALTRFSGEIGFDPDGLAEIIENYREGARGAASREPRG
jgi:triosephosphate isomerase